MAASEKSAGQPIRRLPEIPPPPKRGAVTALRKALVARGSRDPDEHGLSEEAAEAIAVAVADPAQTRTVALGHVSDEQKAIYDTVLKAQLAACAAGARDLRDLAETYGRAVVDAYMEHVQANAAACVRRVISRLNSGAFVKASS